MRTFFIFMAILLCFGNIYGAMKKEVLATNTKNVLVTLSPKPNFFQKAYSSFLHKLSTFQVPPKTNKKAILSLISGVLCLGSYPFAAYYLAYFISFILFGGVWMPAVSFPWIALIVSGAICLFLVATTLFFAISALNEIKKQPEKYKGKKLPIIALAILLASPILFMILMYVFPIFG